MPESKVEGLSTRCVRTGELTNAHGREGIVCIGDACGGTPALIGALEQALRWARPCTSTKMPPSPSRRK